MISKKLKPVHTDRKNLIRIGPNRDGGYIIDKRIIKNINYVITCGLNDDWNFEKHFLKYKKDINILAFDHTVNHKFWVKKFVKDIFHLIIFKKTSLWKIKKIFNFIDYYLFFTGNKKHLKLKITNKISKNKSTTLGKILRNKRDVLLKIDIEGDEYFVLKDIEKNVNKISCLIIEFHNLNNNIKKILSFIKKVKKLRIIHVHGNNVANLDKFSYPVGLEMTLINKKKIKLSRAKNNRVYPIKGLDFPNVKRNPDIQLKFK